MAAALTTNIAALKALIPDPDTAPANRGTHVGGNFDKIDPILAHTLRGECDALLAAITAAAT
jgi:hypothetical protein